MLRFALFGTMSSAQLRKIKKMEAEIRAKIATKQEQEAPGYLDMDASQGEQQTASTSDGQVFQIKKEVCNIFLSFMSVGVAPKFGWSNST